MTVDFINEEFPITQKEESDHKPYIGYIDPNGNLIDYNKPFGESGHDGWDNLTTNAFLQLISYTFKNKNCNLEENIIRGMGFHLNKNDENFDKFLNNLEQHLKYRPPDNPMAEFQYQIYLFFKRAYTNRTFFETIGRTIEVISEKDFMLTNSNDPTRKLYRTYLKQELIQYFKDIAVGYLGYDSLERFQPNGQLIKIPYDTKEYHSFYRPYCSYFYRTPRIITTSSSNINERFYNHLLMEWSIHKIPRYYWNDQTLKFEQEPNYREYYCNEKEEILGKEIHAIRKSIPLKDRYKYFR